MGCNRSKLMEIPWCEPITSFGWSGSLSSCLVGKWTYPWYCLLTYIRANSVWWETEQENDRYHFTPKRWTKYRPRFWTIKRYMNLYTNLRSADTPKKLRSLEKWASPLSTGMQESVCSVPNKWDTDACNLRHWLVRFCFCTRIPSEIRDLYESISMPDSQPLLAGVIQFFMCVGFFHSNSGQCGIFTYLYLLPTYL